MTAHPAVRPTARIAAALASPVLAVGLLGAVAPAASAEAPRPGCGYGDPNHSHQAAPGRDYLEFKPGYGTGDEQNEHTTAPGQASQAGVDAGDAADSPRRGCDADPAV